MLRAIFYLECDYCRDSFSSIQLRTEINGVDWCHVEAGLEESAFDDLKYLAKLEWYRIWCLMIKKQKKKNKKHQEWSRFTYSTLGDIVRSWMQSTVVSCRDT
jgi:hypothetical protein